MQNRYSKTSESRCQNGSQNSPPGRCAPEGEWWVQGACSFFYTHICPLCIFFRALALHAPSHHAPSPHFPFFLFAAGTFPFKRVRNNLRVKCWRGCCAGCKHSARPPRIPFWETFFWVFRTFWSFSVTVFGIDFFMVFHAFHLPFFNAFSINFRCVSHHSFWYFSGMFFKKFSCRISSFFEGLLFERPAFYTVNTMVLTHSAPPESLVSIPEKNEKKTFFRLISRLFLHRKNINFRVLEYSVRAHRFFIVFFIKNVTKMRPNLRERTPRVADPPLMEDFGLTLGSLWPPFGHFWLPLDPFWLPLAPFWLPFGSLLAPFWLQWAHFWHPLAHFYSPRGSIFWLLTSPGVILAHFRTISSKNS